MHIGDMETTSDNGRRRKSAPLRALGGDIPSALLRLRTDVPASPCRRASRPERRRPERNRNLFLYGSLGGFKPQTTFSRP